MCSVITLVFLALFGGGAVFFVGVTQPATELPPVVEVTVAAPTVEPVTPAAAEPNLEVVALLFDPFYVSNAFDSVDAIAGIGMEVFDPAIWSFESEPLSSGTRVTWLSDPLNAVVSIDYLVFINGFKGDVDSFFDDAWVDASFPTYDPLDELARCEVTNVQLREYDGFLTTQEREFDVRYWLVQVDEVHIAAVTLAFPPDRAAERDRVSAALFPLLPSCGFGSE